MLFLKRVVRFLVLSLPLLPALAFAQNVDDPFPVPDSIRPAIDFWVRVYTEADTQSGFLHDAHNLNIVYARLPRDRDGIEKARKQVVEDLKVLASGKRQGLTAAQQGLLGMWGGGTSNARFEQASRSVRWQLGQSDRFVAGLKRSGAYRPYIEQVVREKGLPAELAALPHVESSFHPGAYSSAAASGMWQFMRETAQRFMQVDLVVDERLDPYIATNAAMELLKYNYDALGTWPLALTAYNHGTNGMARAVRDTGTRDIGRIISDYKGSRFGFASRNFYPQFLAALQVERNAAQYFGQVQLDPYPDFNTIRLSAYVDAATLAESLGVSLETLRKYNPALLPAVWSGNKRIPRDFELKIDRSVFGGNLLATIDAIPASRFYREQIPDVSYVVRSGDSLSMIASRYSTSVAELVAINQLRDRHRIRIGQTLVLPQANGVVPNLVVNDTTPASVPASGVYAVNRGDTLLRIAERFDLSIATLMALNNLNENSLIFPGQELLLKAPAAEPIYVAQGPALDEELAIALDTTEEQLAAAGDPAMDLEEEPAQADDGGPLIALAEAEAIEQSTEQAVAERQAHNNDVLASDPADFSVAADNSIEILPEETLGHYADWLGIPTQDLRRLNGIRFGTPVKVGDRLKLSFDKTAQEAFEAKRKQYHSDIQARYFASWRIRNTENYNIKRSDYLMSLAQKRSVPMWLFRQYNPEVEAGNLQIGQVVVFPVVERIN